jgi:predicted transposase/invertase (TIGR01784 family)
MKNTDVKNLTPEEKWEQATIANNYIFYKVMHENPDICKELLEILLEMKIDRIEIYQEKELLAEFGKKGIRMDVYARGMDKSFDLEIQACDTGELPERARYYQGLMDTTQLESGQDFKNLNSSYIIFICIPDIFKKGLGKYTFENLCLENPEIKLNDRAYKYFFIARNYDKLLNEQQKAFMKCMLSNESSSTFTEKIIRMVKNAKLNTQWRNSFMEFERQLAYSFREGKAEGMELGKAEKAVEASVELLKKGIAPEIIAECVKLPLERVLELEKGVKNHS